MEKTEWIQFPDGEHEFTIERDETANLILLLLSKSEVERGGYTIPEIAAAVYPDLFANEYPAAMQKLREELTAVQEAIEKFGYRVEGYSLHAESYITIEKDTPATKAGKVETILLPNGKEIISRHAKLARLLLPTEINNGYANLSREDLRCLLFGDAYQQAKDNRDFQTLRRMNRTISHGLEIIQRDLQKEAYRVIVHLSGSNSRYSIVPIAVAEDIVRQKMGYLYGNKKEKPTSFFVKIGGRMVDVKNERNAKVFDLLRENRNGLSYAIIGKEIFPKSYENITTRQGVGDIVVLVQTYLKRIQGLINETEYVFVYQGAGLDRRAYLIARKDLPKAVERHGVQVL